MFTKLFDGRSLPVLVRALFFAVAAAMALLWLPKESTTINGNLGYLGDFTVGFTSILWAILIPLLALIANELYYRYQLVPGNYQLMVVLAFLLSACFAARPAPVVLLSLGFGTWFFALMRRSYHQENALFSAFDLGLLAGLGYIFNPALLVLLLLGALYQLIIGNGRIKVFIALLLGFGAVGFLTFSILELSGFPQMALRIPAGLTSFELQYGGADFSYVALGGAGFLTFLALLSFLVFSAGMTVYERIMFSAFSLWTVVLWALTLLINHSPTMLTLALLFSGVMIVFLLLKVQNRWLRDAIYLILLLMYAWPWYQALV